MFCTSCGQKLDDEAKFCSNCGTPLKQAGNEEAGQDKAAENAGTINSPTPSSIVLPDIVEDSIEVYEAVISSDGKYLAMQNSSSNTNMQILDTQSGNILRSISIENGPGRILHSVSSDGNYVVFFEVYSGFKIANTQTGEETSTNDGGAPYWGHLGFQFSGDNKRLVTGGKQVKIISLPKGNELLSFPIDEYRKDFSLSPDGRYLVTGSPDAFSLWDARNGNWICKLGSGFISCAFSPESKKIVASGGGMICLWDVMSHDLLLQLEEASIVWKTVRFSPDGKAVVTGSEDGRIHIINAETGEVLKQLRSGNSPIEWASYTPDGKKLVTYEDVSRIAKHVKFWVSE